MNYIVEIKVFYDLVQIKQLSTGQIALWHALMDINNKCGWSEWFTVANLTLQLDTGLSRAGIKKNRNVLKQLGLIDFKPNSTKAASYKIFSLSNKSNQYENLLLNDENTMSKSSQIGSQISSPLNKLNKTKLNRTNNIIINNIKEKEINKEKEKTDRQTDINNNIKENDKSVSRSVGQFRFFKRQ